MLEKEIIYYLTERVKQDERPSKISPRKKKKMGGRREVPRHGGASTMYGKAKGNGNITEKSIINAERVENEYEYVCALLSLAICVCIDLDSYTYSYQFIPLSYWSTFSYYALLRHVSTYINALCAG